MPELDNVSGVDGDVGVDVGRVDPLAGEVFRQKAGRLFDLRPDRGQLHTFRSLEEYFRIKDLHREHSCREP